MLIFALTKMKTNRIYIRRYRNGKIDAYLEETDEIIMEYETAIAERERVIKENQEAIREYEEILESYLLLKTILEA